MEKDNNPEDVKLQIEPLISSDSPIRSHSFSVPQSHYSTPGNSEEEKNQLIQMGFEETVYINMSLLKEEHQVLLQI